jgi:O-antigen/teichoic acid export membrane protein
MGIIKKQTIEGAIWSYLGVLVGFVTTSYFYPQYLTPEVVGLFSLLVAFSNIFGNLTGLGVNEVTSRLFPFFRNTQNGHNGFLFIALIFQLLGFSLFLIFFYYWKPMLVEANLEKSALFAQYAFLLVPITFFVMVYVFLDMYNKLLYNTVLGTLLQEFVQRVLVFGLLVLFIFKLIDLHQLILTYGMALCVKGLVIFIFLLANKQINLKPNFQLLDKKFTSEIFSVAFFGLMASLGSMLVLNLDKIMINSMLDLGHTGVYTIAFYFGTLVVIPSRPLLRIAGTLIAEAWAQNDLAVIKNIYYKSCLNQLIIGGFLFLGIWSNIDNILVILGDDYVDSKWVIFFVGLGYLIDMATGANGHIISLSKYYKVAPLFLGILALLAVSFMWLFIPIWGITGAAVAICAALLLNNVMRYVFLYKKFDLQPFNYRFVLVLGFYIAMYFLLKLIPQQTVVFDILVRGGIITIAFVAVFGFTNISEDIRNIFKNLFS